MHMGTSSGFFLPKFFFRSLVVVGFFCLFVVVSISHDGVTTRQEATKWSSENLKHGKVIGRDNKLLNNEEFDYFNYMSKRRVPNGPDPIHNRRAGNSGQSPGKS